MPGPPPPGGPPAASPPRAGAEHGQGWAAALVRNALAGGGRHLVAAALALLVVPYTLRHLGEARFGVWAITGAVLAALRMLDLGLDRALTRAVARARGGGDPTAAAVEVAASRGLLMLGAAGAALAVWWLREPLVVGIFAVPPALREEAVWAIVITAWVAWVELAWLPWRAALDGLGRMDQSHAVETGQRLLSALGVVLVLSAGGGLRALALKNLFTALWAGWMVRRRLARGAPTLARIGPRLDRATTVGLLRHGGWVQAGHLASLLVEPVHKALLAQGPGLAAVAAYELGLRLASQLAGVLIAAGQAIYPVAAEAGVAAVADDAAAPAGRAHRASLYPLATRYLAWLAWPAAALCLALAPTFAATWLAGASQASLLEDAGRGMALLGACWMATVLAMPAFLMLQAADARGARDGLVAVLVHVGVALAGAALLVGAFGYEGVLFAAALGPVAGGLAAWWRYARRTGGGLTVLAPVLQARVILAAGGAGWLATVVVARWGGWGGLLGAGIVGVLGYLLVLALLRVVTPADRDRALRLWRQLRRSRSPRPAASAP